LSFLKACSSKSYEVKFFFKNNNGIFHRNYLGFLSCPQAILQQKPFNTINSWLFMPNPKFGAQNLAAVG
jgi:hypothetical protein